MCAGATPPPRPPSRSAVLVQDLEMHGGAFVIVSGAVTLSNARQRHDKRPDLPQCRSRSWWSAYQWEVGSDSLGRHPIP